MSCIHLPPCFLSSLSATNHRETQAHQAEECPQHQGPVRGAPKHWPRQSAQVWGSVVSWPWRQAHVPCNTGVLHAAGSLGFRAFLPERAKMLLCAPMTGGYIGHSSLSNPTELRHPTVCQVWEAYRG
jgi:hypothetical protein